MISDYPDGFVLRVRGANDVDRALGALALARDDLAALVARSHDPDGPVLSRPVLGPDGPLLRIGRLEEDDDLLRGVPDLVVARLAEAGLDDAVVDVPEPGGPLDDLDTCPNAVVLRLFPPPAGAGASLPADWIDMACEWALGDLAGGDAVPLRLLGIEFDVLVADAPAIVHQAGLAGTWCDVVNGKVSDRVRTASITFGGAPHVALAAGGPACDAHALMARFELLSEIARELAGELAYACIDLEATFEGIGLGLTGSGWRDQQGASPNVVAGQLCDVLVPDAFAYQIVGKGHVARLHAEGSRFHEPPIATPVADDRFEILIGDPLDWLPGGDTREDVQAEGWELLRPLLATERQLYELLLERPERQVLEPGAPPAQVVGTGGSPDLDDITLDAVPHARRGLHLTALELVSWLAHEHHSDTPATTSPVLATYVRWFASALPDHRRQELKSRARAMIGTAPDQPRTGVTNLVLLAPADVDRAWLATDWLIRVQSVAWLRLAGLTQAAARLDSLGPTSDRAQLMRAVDVLGSAVTIAARRLDLTASVAGGEQPEDRDLVEQAAWAAWERASEAAGWVAASEAASYGVPAEMGYATDLRVIECARDARILDELEVSRRSIGDLAWSAALHAMADEAWRVGWALAHPAVDALAELPLRTALDAGHPRRRRAHRLGRRRARAVHRGGRVRRQGAAHPRRPRLERRG